MFMTGGVTPTGPLADDPRYKQIRDSILKSYARTGRPLEQIEEGFLEGTRLLAPLPFDQRVSAISAMLPNATLESYLKEGTTVPDAVKAMVGLTHMQGKYGAEQIAAMSNHLAYLSTTTDASLEQTTRAASYAVPILRIADFDPGQLLSMITSMQRAEIMNTKSGTWLDNMFERSFPGTSLMSNRLYKAHEAALQRLNLIDKDHKQTFLGDDGKPDAFKFMDILGKAIDGMPKGDMLAVMKSLFGMQGEKAAAFFSDATNQKMIQQSREDEKNFKTGEAAWKDANENSPIVQFRTSFAGLNVELMNLGSNVLPYVTSMLKQANETLGGKGELAVGGLGLLGWMTKGWWGNAAKSLLQGALGYAGTAAEAVLGSPAAIPAGVLGALGLVAATKPNQIDPLTPTGDAMGIYERSWRAQQERMADPEAARARALEALPPAPPPAAFAPPPLSLPVPVKVADTFRPEDSPAASKLEAALAKIPTKLSIDPAALRNSYVANDAYRQDPEAARGRAMMALPPPPAPLSMSPHRKSTPRSMSRSRPRSTGSSRSLRRRSRGWSSRQSASRLHRLARTGARTTCLPIVTISSSETSGIVNKLRRLRDFCLRRDVI